MTKTETEKDILALRYPIDVDVTDDIARKRSVVNFVSLSSLKNNPKVGIHTTRLWCIQRRDEKA